MKPHILEAYTKVYENAKIEGVALIPTISRNDNLYTKKELMRFDGVTVPLNWEHDPNREIGTATFHFDESSFTVFYDGEITDPAASALAKNKTLYTSIEANPTMSREVCNTPGDCFNMPSGLKPIALALTETPGVVQTTVEIVESVLNECNNHKTFRRNAQGKMEEVGQDPSADDQCIQAKISKIMDEDPDVSQDQAVAMAISMCSKEAAVLLNKHGFFEHFDLDYCEDCNVVKKKLNR